MDADQLLRLSFGIHQLMKAEKGLGFSDAMMAVGDYMLTVCLASGISEADFHKMLDSFKAAYTNLLKERTG